MYRHLTSYADGTYVQGSCREMLGKCDGFVPLHVGGHGYKISDKFTFAAYIINYSARTL